MTKHKVTVKYYNNIKHQQKNNLQFKTKKPKLSTTQKWY